MSLKDAGTPKGSFLQIPSTRRGRIRLAGLVLYTIGTLVFPGLPQAVKAAIFTVTSLLP